MDILPQLLWNGLVSGSLYALLALGLSLIYGILIFNNIAHGEMAMVGGYVFYALYVTLGWSIIPAFLGAIVIMCFMAVVIEYTTFLPVKDMIFLIPLVISVSVAIILKNLTLIFFGPNVRSLASNIPTHHLFSGRIIFTDVHIWTLILTAVCFIALFIFIKKTKMGKAIRAVSDNKEAAAILGVDVKLVITVIFIIATILSTIAGIMTGFDQNLSPNMGMFLTLKAFAAVMLGGLGNIPASVLGAFFIGFAENLLIGLPIFGNFYIPSGYKDAIAFVALILILYLRPTGLLGAKASEAVRK